MTSLEKAARQALEALVELTGWQSLAPGYVWDETQDAITALRQALKQQPAESDTYEVLWKQMCERCDELDKKLAEFEQNPAREWVGLTNEEAIDIGEQCQWYDRDCERFDSVQFACAIEAKLKEKNT